jgi:large subunit ribosomal protein L18
MKKIGPRQRRKLRIRKTVSGTTDCPRVSVYRSSRYTYVQVVIDDLEGGRTLLSASTKDKEVVERIKDVVSKMADGTEVGSIKDSSKSVAAAKALGQIVAERCKQKDIARIKFDRNGFIYHGRIQAVADGLRDGGVQV